VCCSVLQYVALSDSCCNVLHRTATHCNALHRTATHCTALQRTAPHCTALHRTTTHCNTLQHTATHCSSGICHTNCVCLPAFLHTVGGGTWQWRIFEIFEIWLIYMPDICQTWPIFEHVELPAKLLDYFLRSNKSNIKQNICEAWLVYRRWKSSDDDTETATHCNILQHTATYCNILQHTATYCNIL